VPPLGACEGADCPPLSLEPPLELDPEDELDESSLLLLPLVVSPGCDGSPLVTGADGCGRLSVLPLDFVEVPPPLEAITTSTIKKSTATPAATSLRRR
jgi:hypothetical protein